MQRSKTGRRAAAFVAVLSAAALGLSACGTTEAGKGSSAGSTSAGPVSITYLHRLPDKEGMTKVDDIVKKWNADHPNIQVKATKFDGKANEMIKKLETDIKANSGPCLAQIGYGEVAEVFVKGMLQDVTTEAAKYKDKFSGAFGQMNVGGKTFGLPQDTGPLIYMYNKVEFEKLGIKAPTTLAEFKDAAKASAAKGKYIAAFTPDEAQYWLSAQAAAAGGVWYSAANDKWKVDANGSASKIVADFWQELLDAKAVLVLDRWADPYNAALTEGKLIGSIAAAWETGFALDVLDKTAYHGQWAVAQLPKFGDKAMTGPDGGSGVAVMKGCAHPAQAMEFNAWFNTQLADLATQGLVPAGKGAVATPDKMKAQFGGQDVMAELAKANDAMNAEFGYMPGFSAVGAEMATVAAKAGKGEAKVAEIFSTAQSASVKALKDAGLPVAE